MSKRSIASLLALAVIVILAGLIGTNTVFWPEDTYDTDGVPQTLDKTWDDPLNTYIPSEELLERISASLPETQDIMLYNSDAVASDNQSNILMGEDGEVFVTFLHDGARYQNSFGYFSYTDGSPPQSAAEITQKIIFPNASCSGSDGELHLGDTAQLGGTGHMFAAGTRIGFFVVSDGWTGDPSEPIEVGVSGMYYSLRDLNPEEDEADRAHFVLLHESLSGGVKKIILGMEDIDRERSYCDHDFNDVIFIVSTNPPGAVDTETMELDELVTDVTDTDDDEVVDEYDVYPADKDRAFKYYCPSADTRGTLAFEDLWPAKGDYDFNDLVLRYRFTNVIDSCGRTKEVNADVEIVAMGANSQNGFGFLLPFSIGQIESCTLSVKRQGEVTFSQDPYASFEASGSETLVVLFDDAFSYITPPQGTLYVNTVSGTERVVGATGRMEIILTEGVTLATDPPFNPFLFRTSNRGIEVHLKDHTPSVLADTGLFGTGDDRTDPSNGQYYRTVRNLPWAIHLPTEWSYPSEQTDIVDAYPLLVEWAESGGQTNKGWYIAQYAVQGALYSP